ncbi:MAG: biotin transporter BioY [Rhodobacteraceae bacterium]|nr:biotin transporter BioY [Paracoccaceae bacterium]
MEGLTVNGSRTLVHAMGGTETMFRKVVMILAGSMLITLGARLSVPMWPVPMSLQTLAVLIVGFGLGSRLGAAAVMTYLAKGAMGLPVFVAGGGMPVLMGPTAGFLFGFVALAYLAGLAVERGLANGLLRTGLVALALSAVLYVPGVLWLSALTPLDVAGAAQVGMLPFVAGDAVKSVLAALMMTGAWAVLGAKRG